MKEVKLELLRHGSNNNQLLSSLMPYLALLDSDPAVSLNLSFEHIELLQSLKQLRYANDDVDRNASLMRLAKQIEQFLSPIRGLDSCKENTNVRLVLSAAELAMLPFELAYAPGTKNQHWLLTEPPALTRESRRRSNIRYKPENEMRVLYIYSDAGGPVPSLAHGKALQDCLRPWQSSASDKWSRRLRVVPNACIEEVLELCRTELFTHVHILAHGAKIESEIDVRYGIALHNRNKDGVELIEGEHLASALLADGKQNKIAAVTLASCDGAQQGGVIGIGGSVAQALHQAGIPMVLGSQFPLTVDASNIIVREIYDGLAWGEDPRFLLRRLRTSLHARFPRSHDWASLVHYFSAGEQIKAETREMRLHRAAECVDIKADGVNLDQAGAIAQARGAIGKLRDLLAEIADDATLKPTQRKNFEAKILRRIATVHQHLASMHLKQNDRKTAIQELELACEKTWKAYQLDSERYDALLNYAVLHLVLKCNSPEHVGQKKLDDSRLIEHLGTAIAAERNKPNRSEAWLLADEVLFAATRALAAGTCAESTCSIEQAVVASSVQEIKAFAEKIQVVCGHENRKPWHSARQQARRWLDLYAKLNGESVPPAMQQALMLMEEFLKALPKIDRPAWDYGLGTYAAVSYR